MVVRARRPPFAREDGDVGADDTLETESLLRLELALLEGGCIVRTRQRGDKEKSYVAAVL